MGSTLKVVSMLQAGRPADSAKMARSSTNILFPCGQHTNLLGVLGLLLVGNQNWRTADSNVSLPVESQRQKNADGQC